MFQRTRLKHMLHCCTELSFVISLIYVLNILADSRIRVGGDTVAGIGIVDSGQHPLFLSVVHVISFVVCCLVLLAVPQSILNFLGLLLYNAFPENVKLKGSSLLTPSICVRIVTRGDFPQLVRDNVAKNMVQCTEAGMDNFLIEVVTDKPIGLPNHRRIREIVVPVSYTPRSGALYKARALQYCLEDDVNVLSDNDYIVHLDEETIMTRDAVRGIINFVLEGKYDFGQGLITYANGQIMNWITTLADSIRVADDMGKLRAQFYIFHKPILNWKGSFIVSKVEAERNVSFDNGIRGSIAEDCYFGMRAFMKNYTFQFIDGEMWEKSPFTVQDFIEQRKRWLIGIKMVVHAPEIPWRYKIWLATSLYAWISMPLSLSNIIVNFLFPVTVPFWMNTLCSFVAAVNMYMYFFGTVKSLSVYRLGVLKYIFCLVSLMGIIFISMIMENVAVVSSLFGSQKKFYVVKKDFNPNRKDGDILSV